MNDIMFSFLSHPGVSYLNDHIVESVQHWDDRHVGFFIVALCPSANRKTNTHLGFNSLCTFRVDVKNKTNFNNKTEKTVFES